MSIKDIMSINVNNLKKTQHTALKAFTIDILKTMIVNIENDNYVDAMAMLFDSPAGDGYGLDNRCISFNYTYDDDNIIDIGDILDKLQSLHNGM